MGGDRQEDGGALAGDGVEVSPDAASTLWASCWSDRTPVCSLPPPPPPLAAQPPPPGQNQAEGSQAVIEEQDEDVEEIDEGEEEFSSEERAFLAERRAAVEHDRAVDPLQMAAIEARVDALVAERREAARARAGLLGGMRPRNGSST